MELNTINLSNLMRFRPSLAETANWFKVSEDTIERKIKKFEKCTFKEFRDRYSGHLKMKLQDKAIDMAMSGNTTMMIFCLKNLCGWNDKVEQQNQEPHVIRLAYSNEDLKNAAR